MLEYVDVPPVVLDVPEPVPAEFEVVEAVPPVFTLFEVLEVDCVEVPDDVLPVVVPEVEVPAVPEFVLEPALLSDEVKLSTFTLG